MKNGKNLLGLLLSASVFIGGFSPMRISAEERNIPNDNCNIFACENFSDYGLDPGTSIEGKKNWVTELVSSGTRGTSFTIADEPGNISNKTLLIKHFAQHNGSTVKLNNERFGQNFSDTVSGKIEFSYRLKPDSSTAFNFYILNGENSTTAAKGVLVKLELTGTKAYVSYFNASDAGEISSRARNFTFALEENEWNSFYIALDTKNNYLEFNISNSQTTAEKMYEAYFPSEIGGFRLEIPRGTAPSNVYADDLYVYSDASDALEQAAGYIDETTVSNEPLNALTGNIFVLPKFVGENGSAGVKWTCDNPDAVNVETSVVTRRKYTQKCVISAIITADAEKQYVKHASRVVTFPVTVLPYDSFTDGEILEDFLDNYIKPGLLSDEPLDKITKDLKPLPLEGPDDIVITWESSEELYLKCNGTVSRPTGEENETVTLTASAIKGNAQREKSFEITILYDLSPQYKVSAAKKALDASVITAERPEAVTRNLTLPTRGSYDTVIEWESSDESVITSQGAVIRADTEKTVVMKAHLICGDAEDWKEIKLTVKMSPQAMANADSEAIVLDEGTVSRTFALPVSGSVYKSNIIWLSDSNCIKISNGYAIVTQPDYEEGDACVTLTAKVTNEDTTVDKKFYFTVPAGRADSELVDEAYGRLDEILGHTSGDSIKDNLTFKTSFTNGVSCKWEVSDSSIIESNGEVNNPGVGEKSVCVTVTATVYKNSVSKTKEYIFTVLPFENNGEILEKAAKMLSFAKISPDTIGAVKNELSLPVKWKYNTEIEWSSSDESILSVADNGSAKIGLVHRPPFGSGAGAAALTAKIEYDGEYITKSFNISVAEEVEYLTYLHMDNEAGVPGETPVASYGKWVSADSENCSFTVGLDPEDAANKVIRIFREKTEEKPAGSANSRYSMQKESYAVDGHAIVTARLYIDADTQNSISFAVRSYGGAQASVVFNTDGSISYISEDNTTLTGTGAPGYEKGKWLKLKFDIDNPAKKYDFYIGDTLMTQNGYITLNGKPYDTTAGVKTIYYNNAQKPCNVYGFDVSLSNTQTSSDSVIYLDDINVSKEREYPENMTEAMNEFEVAFLSRNDISQIRKDLVIPEPVTNEFTVNFYSDNAGIVSYDGKVARPAADTNVVYTVSFSDGTYTAYKAFKLNVMAYDPNEGTDTGDVITLLQGDLTEIITALKTNYQLTSLSGNLVLPKTAKNGSVISYRSSDKNVISDSGVIAQGSKNASAVFTVTVSIGDEKLSEAIDITVRAKSTVESSGGKGGGVSIGKSTVKNTGIIIEENGIVYFTDVTQEHWAYEYISELYKNGIISRADNFRPGDSITRAEFLKMIVCAAKTAVADSTNSGFIDVSASDWYAPYIAAAKEAGIVRGREDSTFAPNENISRQDAAVMCRNMAIVKGYILNGGSETVFADSDDISDYAKDAVKVLAQNSVITGDNGEFRPADMLSRAEAAAIILRLWKMGV